MSDREAGPIPRGVLERIVENSKRLGVLHITTNDGDVVMDRDLAAYALALQEVGARITKAHRELDHGMSVQISMDLAMRDLRALLPEEDKP